MVLPGRAIDPGPDKSADERHEDQRQIEYRSEVIVLWKRTVYCRVVAEMVNMAVQPEERSGHESERGRRIKIKPGRDAACKVCQEYQAKIGRAA